jgi:hypothetical protein
MDYNAHRIARAEYEQMVRSIPSVPEYGYHFAKPKSSKQALIVSQLQLILTTILHFVIK